MGAGNRFARAAFRRAFREGADLSSIEELVTVANSVGLPGERLHAAIEGRATKDALKESTARAWARGVTGVPCVEVDREIFYGDDRLEDAAGRIGDPEVR